MRRLKGLRALITPLFLMTLSCSSQQNNGLTISMVPNEPILIPVGDGITVGGYFVLSAPYFTVNSLNLSWTGTGSLEIVAVELVTTTTSTVTNPNGSTSSYSVNCGFGGDDLTNMFPQNVNSNGNVVFSTGSVVASNPFGCGGVSIPSPAPTSFNIPVTVTVVGVSLDSNNNTTGRVQSTATITVQ